MNPSAEIIESQRITIALLILALIVVALFACLETKREHGASFTAGAYWQDLSQEREDRKLDLDYIRKLEAQVAKYEARERQTAGLPKAPTPTLR